MRDDRFYTLPIFNRKPRVNVAEWAENTRFMPSTSSMFSYIQTPYFREPASYMSDIAGTACVILKTPAQCGKTVSIENMLGWICEYDRANTMIVLDTKKSGEKMSKNRLRPFLRDVCGINNPRNTSQKNPDQSNQVMNIGLGRGANLIICSAKSASDLRSTPVKYLLMDELDAWPDELKDEGDPVLLALKRQMRFRGMAIMTSTPTTKEGRINQNYLLGTQQTWGCICRECCGFMPVLWDDIIFNEGDTPFVYCPTCGQIYNENDIKALKHEYSQPANKTPYMDDYNRIWRSYEVHGTLCHEFYSWDGLKRAEMAALSLGESSYRSFKNTTLGDIYEQKDSVYIEVPELVASVSASYTIDALPDDIEFVTIGVDTHDKCLYVETAGFSADLKRIYGIDYRILMGDPSDSDVWIQLHEITDTYYRRVDGCYLRPMIAFCDSGGHRTNAVYMQSLRNRRLRPIKGYFSGNTKGVQDPLIGKLQKIRMNAGVKANIYLQFIGVNAGKDALSEMELRCMAGDQCLFFPNDYGYTVDYFRGLLAERKIEGRWVAPKKGHTHNEPLDCRVYAMAAAEYYYTRFYKTGKDRACVLTEDQYMRIKEKKERKLKAVETENVEVDAPKKERKRRKVESEIVEAPKENKDEAQQYNQPKPSVKPKFPHL